MFLLLDISSSQDTGISQIRGYNVFCNNIRYILWFYLYDSYQLLKKVKIIFRILLQETFVILDSLFYDKGTLAEHKTDYSSDSSISVSYSDDGTTLSRSQTAYSINYMSAINGVYQWRDSSKDYCIEVDINDFDNRSDGGGISVGFGGTTQSIYQLNNNVHSGNGHLKIVTDGDSYKCYWNDVEKTTKTMTNNNGFIFSLYRNPTITFKNLVIYTI